MSETTETATETPDSSSGLYLVEKILDRRIRYGMKEYLVKWEGYDEESNSWEPETHLGSAGCALMIKAFRKARKKARKSEKKGRSRPKRKACKSKKKERLPRREKPKKKKLTGFNRGLQPEKIFGATKESPDYPGKLTYLMKWKGRAKTEVVLAEQANILCPDIVIAYLETCVVFYPNPNPEDGADGN